MPELPEVETTLRGLRPHLVGKKLTRVAIRKAQLRWPIPPNLPELIEHQPLLGMSRRGKYLLFEFERGQALVHLGMSGSLRILESDRPPGIHDHFDWHFGPRVLRYHDPRRFGCLLWANGAPGSHPLLARLGPEPLGPEFTADYLFTRSRKRSQAIKQFIMDSHQVVGVGNIYANESLFKAGILPLRQACALTHAQCQSLVDNIKQVLNGAIAQGGTTLRDFVGGDGKPGYFQQQLLVYGRGGEPCKLCSATLTEIRMSARATVYCGVCQE
jgi:formamidopyrimidine-DNA glycosylase